MKKIQLSILFLIISLVVEALEKNELAKPRAIVDYAKKSDLLSSRLHNYRSIAAYSLIQKFLSNTSPLLNKNTQLQITNEFSPSGSDVPRLKSLSVSAYENWLSTLSTTETKDALFQFKTIAPLLYDELPESGLLAKDSLLRIPLNIENSVISPDGSYIVGYIQKALSDSSAKEELIIYQIGSQKSLSIDSFTHERYEFFNSFATFDEASQSVLYTICNKKECKLKKYDITTRTTTDLKTIQVPSDKLFLNGHLAQNGNKIIFISQGTDQRDLLSLSIYSIDGKTVKPVQENVIVNVKDIGYSFRFSDQPSHVVTSPNGKIGVIFLNDWYVQFFSLETGELLGKKSKESDVGKPLAIDPVVHMESDDGFFTHDSSAFVITSISGNTIIDCTDPKKLVSYSVTHPYPQKTDDEFRTLKPDLERYIEHNRWYIPLEGFLAFNSGALKKNAPTQSLNHRTWMLNYGEKGGISFWDIKNKRITRIQHVKKDNNADDISAPHIVEEKIVESTFNDNSLIVYQSESNERFLNKLKEKNYTFGYAVYHVYHGFRADYPKFKLIGHPSFPLAYVLTGNTLDVWRTDKQKIVQSVVLKNVKTGNRMTCDKQATTFLVETSTDRKAPSNICIIKTKAGEESIPVSQPDFSSGFVDSVTRFIRSLVPKN